MSIAINPGAGPIAEPSEPEQAAKNMAVFLEDLAAGFGIKAMFQPMNVPDPETEEPMLMGGTRYSKVHDGRWPFRLWVNGVKHVFEMPGTSTELVRFMHQANQNIWDFPRVYIDGSSWVWDIALRVVTHPDE